MLRFDKWIYAYRYVSVASTARLGVLLTRCDPSHPRHLADSERMQTERLAVVCVGAELLPEADEPETQRLPRIHDVDLPTERYAKQRSGRRAVVQLPAVVVVRNRCVDFVIDNISSSGARLAGPLTLELGQHIEMSFVLDTTTVVLAAEIVRVHTTDLVTDQIAVRFVEPSAETVTQIDIFVAALLG
jgi:hypothetical protein